MPYGRTKTAQVLLSRTINSDTVESSRRQIIDTTAAVRDMKLLNSGFISGVGGPIRLASRSNVKMVDIASICDVTSLMTSATNAWSVSGDTLGSSDLASSLFASSLAPYLVMLFFLSRKPTKTPPLANFGFQFLLAFVFATIPAGIYAKVHYHDVLANIDWLHGGAESLLTVTNLLILFGFRSVRPLAAGVDNGSIDAKNFTFTSYAIPALIAISLMFDPGRAEVRTNMSDRTLEGCISTPLILQDS